MTRRDNGEQRDTGPAGLPDNETTAISEVVRENGTIRKVTYKMKDV